LTIRWKRFSCPWTKYHTESISVHIASWTESKKSDITIDEEPIAIDNFRACSKEPDMEAKPLK
jgi:hypothetical protein